MPAQLSFPALNWKELARYIPILSQRVRDLYVDRLFIPERSEFPQKFLKGEWALRLKGMKKDCCLVFSIRPRHPYIILHEGKGPQVYAKATHAGFDLSLSKWVSGAKIKSIEVFPRERDLTLWFDSEVGLVLSLIPNAPEAYLIENTRQTTGNYPIITHSKSQQKKTYTPPSGKDAPEALEVRNSLTEKDSYYAQAVENYLAQEAFELRKKNLEKTLREQSNQLHKLLKQLQTTQDSTQKEPDWELYGTLLKNHLHALPSSVSKTAYSLASYEDASQKIDIPRDPKLSPQEQVEKFFNLAKRKARRLSESEARSKEMRARLSRISRLQEQIGLLEFDVKKLEFEKLEKIEMECASPADKTPIAKIKAQSSILWAGKTFLSKDKTTIWIGRNAEENQELTFKIAKGNDLWLHVKGRAGSHGVISVPSGKSASLETLLDAANLVLYYSLGRSAGKTEVDYTFKKYVKRNSKAGGKPKGGANKAASADVHYTQNKTLLITLDPERLSRLLSQQD